MLLYSFSSESISAFILIGGSITGVKPGCVVRSEIWLLIKGNIIATVFTLINCSLRFSLIPLLQPVKSKIIDNNAYLFTDEEEKKRQELRKKYLSNRAEEAEEL